jgi:hypothetical protein
MFLSSACVREAGIDQEFLQNSDSEISVSKNLTASNNQDLINVNEDLVITLTSDEAIELRASINLEIEVDGEDRIAICTQSSSTQLSCSYKIGSQGDDFNLSGVSFVINNLDNSSGNLKTVDDEEIIPTVINTTFFNVKMGYENFILWMDAADNTTVYSDASCTTNASHGQAVRCWVDKAQDMQFTNSGSDVPAYIENFYNGTNSVSFNFDKLVSSTPVTLNSFTLFVVYDVVSWAALNYFIGSLNETTYGIGMGFGGNWNGGNAGKGIFLNQRSSGPITTLSSSVEPSSFGVATFQNDKTFRGITENTPYLDTTTSPSHSFSQIGKRFDNHSCCQHIGRISELLIFNTTLNADERQKVWCYLSEKYTLGFTGCNS